MTRHYDTTEVAKQELIPAMLDDIGIQGEAVREATAKFAATLIGESPDKEMGDLQQQMACYAHGFREGRGIE